MVRKRLDNIIIENEDCFLETGIKNFGFGYPLLVKPDKKSLKKIIVAPVFIWSLDVQKSNVKNEWIITKSEENYIKINELLVSHIKQDEGIDIPKFVDELDDGCLQKEEIIDYLNKLLKTLDAKQTITNIDLRRCLANKENIEKLTYQDAWIQWSGIF